MATAGGRSAKTAPFWTSAWCAMEQQAMKMAKQGPMRRVTMCPYLAWSLQRICSSLNNGWRSHKKLLSMGTAKGPGGSFFLLELLVAKLESTRNDRQFV